MTRDVNDALASHTNDYEIRHELHAVPPHSTYEVMFDGTRAVCKLARGSEADPTTEARIIEFVGRETSVPVPRILAVGPDYFIAEWHDGVPNAPRGDEGWARAVGTGMATLHTETAATFETTGLLRSAENELTLDGFETWPATVSALLEDRREYLTAFGYADVAYDAIEFVRAHPDAFAGYGDPVLCHGNLLPDHAGVADDELTCVIDFEHALVGPGEYDYWRMALPVFEGQERPDCHAAFREGYESVRPLPAGFDRRADLYRMLNAVSYLKSLYLQRQITGRETARRAEWFAERVRGTLADLRTEYE
jgi:fructosamine-3-kinase